MITAYVSHAPKVSKAQIQAVLDGLKEAADELGLDLKAWPVEQDEKEHATKLVAGEERIDAKTLAEHLNSEFNLRIHLTGKKVHVEDVESPWGHKSGQTLVCSIPAVEDAVGKENVLPALKKVGKHGLGEALDSVPHGRYKTKTTAKGTHCEDEDCVMGDHMTTEDVGKKDYCGTCKERILNHARDHIKHTREPLI
ncbi:hypothetical protein ACFLQ2_02420 [archaeon]